MDTRLKEEETARVEARKAKLDAKAAEDKEQQAARKAQAAAAGTVWKVDLDVVAKNADAAAPKEERQDQMKGLKGVQANIEKQQAALRAAGGVDVAEAAAADGKIDHENVPTAFRQPLKLDKKYEPEKV